MGSRLLRVGGNNHGASTFPVFGVPSSTLLPERAAPRAHRHPRSVLWTQKGLVWTGAFVSCFKRERSETQALGCFLRHIPSNSQTGKPTFHKDLVAPGTKGGQEKVLPSCGHFLLNYTEVHTGTLIHKGCGSVNDSGPQETR